MNNGLKLIIQLGMCLAAGCIVTGNALAQVYYASAAPKQKPKPEPPAGSLLSAAPDYSQWIINFTYAEDEQKTGDGAPTPTPFEAEQRMRRPRKILMTKTKDIMREDTVLVNGKQVERWYNGKTQYFRPPGQTTWFMSSSATRDIYAVESLPPSGFRDLELVTAANYSGIGKYNKIDCLVFVPGGSSTLNLSDAKPQNIDSLLETLNQVVLVDLATRLPILMRNHGETRTYTFLPAPPGMLTLPDDLVSQLKKGAEGARRLVQAAARPY